jgi:hypothetical protein
VPTGLGIKFKRPVVIDGVELHKERDKCAVDQLPPGLMEGVDYVLSGGALGGEEGAARSAVDLPACIISFVWQVWGARETCGQCGLCPSACACEVCGSSDMYRSINLDDAYTHIPLICCKGTRRNGVH